MWLCVSDEESPGFPDELVDDLDADPSEGEYLCPDDGESPARLEEQLLSAVVVHGGSRVDGSRRES